MILAHAYSECFRLALVSGLVITWFGVVATVAWAFVANYRDTGRCF